MSKGEHAELDEFLEHLKASKDDLTDLNEIPIHTSTRNCLALCSVLRLISKIAKGKLFRIHKLLTFKSLVKVLLRFRTT